jgi:hypothetical protein
MVVQDPKKQEQTVDGQPPDIYCDSMQLMVSPFDVILQLSQRSPSPGTTEPAKIVGHVRMSLEHAKVMAIILRKALKQHEEVQGSPIVLHPQIYQQMGISREEDW